MKRDYAIAAGIVGAGGTTASGILGYVVWSPLAACAVGAIAGATACCAAAVRVGDGRARTGAPPRRGLRRPGTGAADAVRGRRIRPHGGVADKARRSRTRP